MKIAIIGAGPAGLSAARYLSDLPEVSSVTILERELHLGGLQRSFEFEGVHFDVGTILFFEAHGLLEAFPHLREVMVPIKYQPFSLTPSGSHDRYPFSIKGYLRDNGWLSTGLGAAGILVGKLRYAAKDTVQAYAKYYMGARIYEQSGLKNYIYRLHDMPDEEIDVEFAKKRLNLIERQGFRRMFKAMLPTGKKKTVTGPRLVRPAKGFEYFYDMIGNDLRERNVKIRLGEEIQSVGKSQGETGFDIRINDTLEHFDRVVSTAPIPDMLKLMGESPAADIRCKDLVSLFYLGKFRNRGNTFFNFTFEGDWKRITVFSRFYQDGPEGQDYFTVEVTTSDPTVASAEAAARDFEQHAAKYNMLEGEPRLLGHHLSINAYPVYLRGQQDNIEQERQRLINLGIDLIGRQGNFEYFISNYFAKRAKKLSEQF